MNNVTLSQSYVTLTSLKESPLHFKSLTNKMRKLSLIFKSLAVLSGIAVMTTFTSCTNNSGNGLLSQSGIDSLRDQITELTKGNEMIAKNLVTFDTLDNG